MDDSSQPPSDQYEKQQYEPTSTRQYQIREKIFSLRDNFKIKDEMGQDVFTVRAKMLSIGDNLMLEDMDGNPLMQIRQDVMHLQPTFNILSARDDDLGRELAVVKKKFTFSHNKFKIESVYGQYDLRRLDILAHSYTLVKSCQIVATISKSFVSFTDSYDVEISGDEDHAFILALAIVLDQIIYDNRNNH